MTAWTDRPRWQPPSRRDGLATARDIAIIALCVVILAFVLLAWLTPVLEAPPPRRTSPATDVRT